MPKYFIKTTVDFCGEVEAKDEKEAESMGWEWEDLLMYDGVFDIVVEEMEDDEEEED
jgi:uncharacterized protein with GYD domain